MRSGQKQALLYNNKCGGCLLGVEVGEVELNRRGREEGRGEWVGIPAQEVWAYIRRKEGQEGSWLLKEGGQILSGVGSHKC